MERLHYLLMKSHAMLSKRVLSEASQIRLTSGQPKILDYLLQYEEADKKTETDTPCMFLSPIQGKKRRRGNCFGNLQGCPCEIQQYEGCF